MITVISETDLSESGAIAQYELAIADTSSGPMELTVEPCGAPDKSASYNVVPGQSITIGVHSHLLPEGSQDISFQLDQNGKEIGSVRRCLNVGKRTELGNRVRAVLQKNGAPLFFQGPCDSRHYPYDDPEAIAWFDQPNALEHIDAQLASGEIDELAADALRHFVEHGFMTFEGLIDDALIDQVNEEIDHAISTKHGGYEYGSSERIEHLHLKYPNIRKLWLDPRLTGLAELVFEDVALPCQSLTFVFGSQQDAHQDTVHLTPFPAGYMCGLWIALQDVEPGSGELVVYPGSHRERRIYLKDAGIQKVEGDWSEFGQTVVPIWKRMTERYDELVYRPKKGTVLVWHENLLHGGSQRLDSSLERRSIVIHAFSQSAVVYYDSTGYAGRVARAEGEA